MRLLVTGASGFVGRRLVAAARARWPQAELTALGGPGEADGLDVTDAPAVRAAVGRARPTHVIHLAAIAAVVDAGRDPQSAFAVNLGGALNLVEALRAEAAEAQLLHVSSAEAYGRSLREAEGAPVDERALLQPSNAYAASKAGADLLVQAAAAQGLAAVVARPFNHIGAGQTEAFVAPAFAAQIARAEAGLQPPVIEVGGLEDARDFLAVDDVVDAYLRLLDMGSSAGAPEVFNVASGVPLAIGELLARLTRLSAVALEVRVDPSRLRRDPPAAYVGDASRLRRATGWAPRGDMDAVLREVLDEQRARVRAS
ncbi:MAG: GDP-mannose 4,6-dehydratase [Caulobacteraceae bacterium]|nr:GDP-mannose 4,6-dehydratase [Caulobacter sp.]